MVFDFVVENIAPCSDILFLEYMYVIENISISF
jgi:hypothetical protein